MDSLMDSLSNSVLATADEHAQAKRLALMRSEASRILLDNSWRYARIHAEGVARLMLDPGATEFLKIYGLYPESGGLLGEIVDQGLVTAISQLRTRRRASPSKSPKDQERVDYPFHGCAIPPGDHRGTNCAESISTADNAGDQSIHWSGCRQSAGSSSSKACTARKCSLSARVIEVKGGF